jgi:hypothetical protein
MLVIRMRLSQIRTPSRLRPHFPRAAFEPGLQSLTFNLELLTLHNASVPFLFTLYSLVLSNLHPSQNQAFTAIAGHSTPLGYTTHAHCFHANAHSFVVFCNNQKLNSFVFNKFHTLCAKHPAGGEGVPFWFSPGRRRTPGATGLNRAQPSPKQARTWRSIYSYLLLEVTLCADA